MMGEYRAYKQTCEVAGISEGKKATAHFPESKQCCSHCENYNAEPQSRFTKVFLGSWDILEEKDNVLLPQQEPGRSWSQFSSLNFSSSRMAGNTL